MPAKDAQERSADRWSSWRRGATVSVIPAGTRMFRVFTKDAERIIGLGAGDLALMGARASATESAGDVLVYLDRVGFLRARQYGVTGNDRDGWVAEPGRELALLADRILCVELLDPEADLEDFANAA